MHFPSFTLGTALLLNVLPVFGKFCWPKGNPKKVVLNVYKSLPYIPQSTEVLTTDI